MAGLRLEPDKVFKTRYTSGLRVTGTYHLPFHKLEWNTKCLLHTVAVHHRLALPPRSREPGRDSSHCRIYVKFRMKRVGIYRTEGESIEKKGARLSRLGKPFHRVVDQLHEATPMLIPTFASQVDVASFFHSSCIEAHRKYSDTGRVGARFARSKSLATTH